MRTEDRARGMQADPSPRRSERIENTKQRDATMIFLNPNKPFENVAEPFKLQEIVGGRYDGDYRVWADCPGCGETVEHIVDAFARIGGHRRPDCNSPECRSGPGYDVVLPLQGIGPDPWFRWWDTETTPNLGFGVEGESEEAPSLFSMI